MNDSIINNSEIFFSAKICLRTEFYFFIWLDNNHWECLTRFNFSSREEAEKQLEKIKNIFSTEEKCKVNGKPYDCERLSTSEIYTDDVIKLCLDNLVLPLPVSVEHYIISKIKNSSVFNSIEYCTYKEGSYSILEFDFSNDFDDLCANFPLFLTTNVNN